MSKETIEDLNTLTLIGYTDKRGKAWHYRAASQGDEPNHYPQEVPVADVKRRLFAWQAVEGSVTGTALIERDGEPFVLSTTDDARKAIMRNDTGHILGVFGQGYKIHQYDQWLVDNVERLLDADLRIGSAGLLKGGAQAWVQIEMPETLQVEAGGTPVEFRPFLTAATSMDGSLATTYLTGVQVVVCDNTLSAALHSTAAEKVRVKHSTNSLARIGDVRQALGIVYQVADEFTAQVNELTAQYVSDTQWSEFVRKYTWPGDVPTQRSKNMAATKIEELERLWRFDERVAPWKNSAYGVLAAVNTHVHHVQSVRNVSRAERNMDRAITGGVDKLDRATLELLATV